MKANNQIITLSDEQIRKIKEIELQILLEIDKICKINEIEYFIFYGTLLGAVRHKGFIPWDDDIDIVMTKENYDRFKECFSSQKLFLQDIETDKHFFSPLFAKVLFNNTTMLEQENVFLKAKNGVWVDIFILRECDSFDSKAYKKLSSLKKYFTRKVYCKRLLKTQKINSILAGLRALFYPPLSKTCIKKRINKLLDKEFVNKQYYIDPFTSDKALFPKALFTNKEYLEFENHQFPAPAGYKEALELYYGDYMTLPPISERKTLHKIVELKL